MAKPPSGEQFEISFEEQHATIVEVGGGLRSYRDGDRDVLQPYPLEAICDGAHGAVLIPWPNRLGDGRYRFDGVDYQVPLTEPERRNAIHGFLRWRPWQRLHQSSAQVVVATTLHPRPGYPWTLEVQIRYGLDEAGLTVETTATNAGEGVCPFGSGQHPYLSPGTGLIDDCTLSLGADTRIVTDPERQLPTGVEPVEGTQFDFRAGRRIADLQVDSAFQDLARDVGGRAWVRLAAPDGNTAELWADKSYPIIQIYTADTLAPDRRRLGLAAEPITCPPNAFQTGQGVIRLQPGESVTATWGARLRETAPGTQ